MKNVILHGFGATAESSSTVNALREALGPDNVVGISYSYWDADAAAGQVTTQIKDIKEPVVLIGVSLGGFWARYAASQCPNVDQLILLNPSLNAHTSVSKYENTTVNGHDIKPGYADAMTKYRIVKDYPELPIHIAVCLDDDVVDPEPTVMEMKDRAQMLIMKTGGHRIDCSKQEVIQFINKAIDTIFG